MTFRTVALIGLLGFTSLTVAHASLAQDRPAKPDGAKIAQQLGVSEATLQSCMPRPERSDTRPARPDMSKVLPCLQKDNASLTEAKVNQVMESNRPQRQRS